MAQAPRKSHRTRKTRSEPHDPLADLSELSAHFLGPSPRVQSSPISDPVPKTSPSLVGSIDKQLQLEQLKHENLKLQLELAKVQLELSG